MNKQRYAQLYAKFHGANRYNVGSADCNSIQYRLFSQYSMRNAVLKMKGLDRFANNAVDYPLVQGLMAYLNVDRLATVFYDDSTWAVLLGNKQMVYPQENGEIVVTATAFFVNRAHLDQFRKHLREKFKVTGFASDLVYKMDNLVLYMDPHDVVYPGGVYFARPWLENEWFRICYLNRVNEPLPEEKTFLLPLSFVKFIPFHTRCVETVISSFLCSAPCVPVQPIAHEAFGNVIKVRCFIKPRFIVQDVLNSYDGQLRSLGLLIEAPIRIGFDSFSSRLQQSYQPRYHALVVNGVLPHKVLFVPAPYDKYYVYSHDSRNSWVDWIPVQYSASQVLPQYISSVACDGDFIGFVYHNAFFCLSHVMIGNNASVRHRYLSKIFNLVKFDLEAHKDVVVLNTYAISDGFRLHQVKLTQLPYELWCMSKGAEEEGGGGTVKPEFPPLVREWSALVIKMGTDNQTYANMSLIRIVGTLVKHGVCFNIEVGTANPDIKFSGVSDITFLVNENAQQIVNKLRFDEKTEKQEIIEPSQCTIM